jgi:two-component system sensor histidine kinase CpxA
MSWLTKLNPICSLYGRIFLWFWLATVLMIASSIWLAKQLRDEVEFRPLRTAQVEELNNTKGRLQGILDRELAAGNQPKSKFKRIVFRLGKRHQRGLLLVEPKSQSFIYSFSDHMLPDTEPFLELLNQESPLSIRLGHALFVGPTSIAIGGSDYLLFIGRPAPQGFLGR